MSEWIVLDRLQPAVASSYPIDHLSGDGRFHRAMAARSRPSGMRIDQQRSWCLRSPVATARMGCKVPGKVRLPRLARLDPRSRQEPCNALPGPWLARSP